MKATLFKQLAQSLREAGRIRRGEMKPTRTMTFDAKHREAWDKLEAFHAHGMRCPQCRHNPFNLCATGRTLLEASRAAQEATEGDLSVSRSPDKGTAANGAQID